MKKLLTLFTLLLCVCSGAWATTYDNPTRTTHKVGDATKTFVNASSTDGNVTSGNDRYLCYGTLYMLNSVTGDKFFERTSSTGGTTSSSYTYSTPATGFLAASSTSGTNTYGSINASSSRKWAMYFTGATQVSVLKKDNNTTDSKWVVLKLYSVAANGTETLVETKESSTNADKSNLKVLTCSTALSTSTYYKLEISAGYDSNNAIYQVSLKKPASAPTITAQPQDANYVEGTAAADVTALSVTATGTGDLYYQWFSNTSKSTTGAVSVQDKSKADGANTYKPSAATSGTTYYYCAVTDDNGTTNSGFATVVVSAASAPTSIEISGANSAARGADAITLTADVTGGVPTPTIEWFKCDDALKTNPVSQGGASTSNTTLNVATTTVGTYYYYAVASNSQGNVASNVKTITIVPKAPTITATGTFADSKDVTIAKADGEDASAVIKYSTDDGANWNDYSDAFNVTETTTVKAKVIQSGLESDVVSATYTKLPVIVDTDLTEGASWDFTSYTTDERNELKNNTDFWTESTSKDNKRYANKVTLSDEHLRGNDGYELSFTTGLKYTVAAVNKLRFDPDENRCWMDNGVVVIIPGLKAGQKVMADIKTSNSGGEARGMNSTNLSNVVGFNETSSERNTSYGYVTEDGDVTLTCNGGLNVYSITILPATVPVTITEAGYASFASTSALDFTDSGITAYIATANGTDNVTMTEIAKVPANTGVVLKGTEGTVNVPVLTGDADATTGNLLKPGEKTVSPEEATAGTIYAFGRKGGQVGFVKAHEGFTITAGKAYLDLSATPAKGADFLSFVFGDEEQGETDGIKAVSTKVENGVRYNLAGQKVGADYKGIVIVNGKKFVVK